LINEAKVGGVLVRIQTQGEKVTSALVGIGLNVETKPEVPPTPFVPRTEALSYTVSDPAKCTQGTVFRRLTSKLAENYRKLLNGQFWDLLAIYRQRSIVVGKEVTLYEDREDDSLEEIARGRVASIGENLELKMEGMEKPVWKGRLAF
jgi:biotin-(acetyl-CoA carboxylase) ligase